MKLRTAFTGLGLAFMATAAVAGLTQPAPVIIDTVGMVVTGDQTTARYSKNNVELIGCGVRKLASGFTFGFCQARDAAGVNAGCSSEDPALLDLISSSSDFGFITFSYDVDGICTRIGFSNQSFYLPQGLKAN